MEHEELTQKIIGCAMKVHCILGPGFLESVYQNALAHEVRKAGLWNAKERFRSPILRKQLTVGGEQLLGHVATCPYQPATGNYR